MPTSFVQYEMLPTTWFYLSTLIILTVFFKFNRFWSVRNLDILGLIAFTPGLIILAMRDDQWGYAWLFTVGVFFVVRLIFDTVMVRRPLLEPNLTPGGLIFSCFFLVMFMILSVTVNQGDRLDTVRTVRLEQILTSRGIAKKTGMNPITLGFPKDELKNLGPGFLPFLALSERSNLILAPSAKIRSAIIGKPAGKIAPSILPSTNNAEIENLSPTKLLLGVLGTDAHDDISSTTLLSEKIDAIPEQNSTEDNSSKNGNTIEAEKTFDSSDIFTDILTNSEDVSTLTEIESPISPPSLGTYTCVMLAIILSDLLIVFGFFYIGHCHFGNFQTGVACATIYLLLPYTNQMAGRLDHLVPAALIIWSVAMYRRPFFAGLWLGIAAALVWYPICLVPLWWIFYWRSGWIRFVIGCASACIVAIILLVLSPVSLGSYGEQLLHLFGKSSLWIFSRPDGFWSYYDMIYRVPVIAAFFALCFGMIMWPSHKNLATLMSCSALLLLSVQFWQLHEGGLFMSWFLPLLILTIFRPNLEDRTAQASVIT